MQRQIGCLRAALLVGIALEAHSSFASDRFVFHDAGFERTFELALDEIAVSRGEQRRVVTKIPAASRESLRQDVTRRRLDLNETAELVLYEVVNGQRFGTPRIVTDEVYLEIETGANIRAAALKQGAIEVRPTDAGPDHWIVTAADSPSALDLAARLRNLPGIKRAEPLLARQQTKKFVPNDTFFTNQWHLRNTGQFNGTAGVDVRITNVWDAYRGAGIKIAIIDDGLQTAHPDLAANVNTNIDWDFNFNDGDPNPGSGDDHGTACAGVAAAVGNNGLGVSGAAPEATLVGLRLISLAATDAQEAQAMSWSNAIIQIKSNSWGPSDNGATLEGPGPLTAAALSNSCWTGRNGLGVLNFWAGGNGLQARDNSNFDGYANSIFTIAIGAVANTGIQSWYSEPGANLVVVAPSSGNNLSGADIGIWTTDRTGSAGYNTAASPNGDYATDFGGTSSATPLAAGVGALVLQANPLLGWRDVQEILIRSATRNHPADADWRPNAAGIWFNHKYGGGMINASGAVAMATTWTNLGPQSSITTNQTGLNVAIPDNNTAGITRTFQVTSLLRVEHVVLRLSATHTYRGDLHIELVSPANTTSQLTNTRNDSGRNYTNWPFMSVRHWGESSVGTWTLRVSDRVAQDVGSLTAASLILYGSGGDVPSNQPPVLASVGNKNVAVSNTLAFVVNAADPVDGDPITLAAENLPSGASFGATNGVGAFLWTNAGPVGVYHVTLSAADKDGTNTETIAITVFNPGVGGPTNYIVNFEGAGETKGTYTSGNVTLSGISWNMSDALIGTSVNTDRMNGARSARLRTNGVMTMQGDITGGVASVGFLYAKYGADTNSNLALDYSADGGSVWVNAGTVSVTSATLQLYQTNINQAGNIRLRIRHTGPAGATRRANVDDIFTTSYGAAAPSGCVARMSFTNSSVIVLNDNTFGNGAATPYPSTIAVSGVTSSIKKVTVTISNINHGFIFDLDALLVGPGGQAVVLFSNIGEFSGADNITWTFDDDADEFIPDQGAVESGTFRPSEGNLEAFLNPPAPPPPYSYQLSVFTNANPNGTWSLYFWDWVVGDDGVIDGGWSIHFDYECPVPVPPSSTGACSVILSEYVEGSGNNKALELFNGTTNAIALGVEGYKYEFYFNGNTSVGLTINLTGTVAAGATYVVAHTGASDVVLGLANQTGSGNWYNGNDAIVLRRGTNIVDSIGQVGNSAVFGENLTLVRRAFVRRGDFVITDPFTAPEEWIQFPQNTFNNLGNHSMDCRIETPVDSDGDGIDDEWEIFWFGDLVTADETTDWDLDGFSDLHEFLAGTDPKDPNSLLEVVTSRVGSDSFVVIQWQGISGKSYSVVRSTNLLGSIQQVIATNVPGVSPLNTYTGQISADSSMFWIKLE